MQSPARERRGQKWVSDTVRWRVSSRRPLCSIGICAEGRGAGGLHHERGTSEAESLIARWANLHRCSKTVPYSVLHVNYFQEKMLKSSAMAAEAYAEGEAHSESVCL